MELVFEPGWFWPVAVLVVGVTVFWTGNRRLDKGLRNVGGGIVLLAVLWGVVAWAVQTPREKAVARTKGILTAYENRDWGKLESLLDAETTMARYGNRGVIMTAAKMSVDNPGVKDLYVLSTEASRTQTYVAVTVTVVTTVERAAGQPVRSTWRFEYVNMGGEWVLTTITPVELNGQSPEGILREMPRVGG